MLPTYYSSEAVANGLFSEVHKVCALCDANFPVKRMVKVESMDGKPVTTPTHMLISEKGLNRIMEVINRRE